ncbi:uncharacterized protein LTR77_000685 [Saxophila tyrrhenica]|uniref:Glycoside hydrolase family 92 protein n=1 Tax=Saxophila tyrrhenica TaxID=1690608 RepID=A0AAV9PP15_9PEZI|nr:hypothetical protein LTR77_000685 [Saxophila tyrrhenica]
MRKLFSTSSFLLSLPLSAHTASYHDDVGVLQYVNPKIGTLPTYGDEANQRGGMVPSVSPPFGMTRWTPQTRENFISQCPYDDADEYIHGFQATHQPAIWMGESGQVVLGPGIGEVKPLFTERAHRFTKANERSTAYVYQVTMDAESVEAGLNLTESIYSPVPGGAQPVPAVVSEGANGRTRRDLPSNPEATAATLRSRAHEGTIHADMTATSHVGLLQFSFPVDEEPYVFLQATRQNWTGEVEIDPAKREIWGSNPQRQDYDLGLLHAPGFNGYFVSRFSQPFSSHGVAHGRQLHDQVSSGRGEHVGAYVTFEKGLRSVEVRTGVSFVSIEQARRNLDLEAPDSESFSDVVDNLKSAWLDKLGRVTIEGYNKTDADHDPRTIWYTSLFHALQYPSDFSEPLDDDKYSARTFYSGYTDSVHEAHDSYYQSWSIWDTFRAEHSTLTMFAPERVNSMMRSLVRIFEWSGRLPMWANVVETNIMIGTHVDAVIANALERGFEDFDVAQAWAGVKKNAYVPPLRDTELLYYDREPNTPDEVRAGLTAYLDKGYVPNDRWAESGSRTLDYAFDDYAASVVAAHADDMAASHELLNRSMNNYRTIYNADTGFMEARNDNGTWAGRDQGWSEGDDWIYTFDVMHDPKGLAALLGGKEKMKAKLDKYFEGGHNQHSNEPSHHAPYMYAAIGYPAWTQNLTRSIAYDNYNATSAGLSGNEDLGQMSSWYLFSALGFYPVNPSSDEYVVGAPWFENVTIRFPAGASTGGIGGKEHTLTITAPGAVTKPFVKSLTVDGKAVDRPLLHHKQIVTAKCIAFEMADTPRSWGCEGI